MSSKQNIMFEQDILGLLLYDGSSISKCNLSHSDFSQRSHQIIFSAIQQVISKGQIVDVVSVSELIEKEYGVDSLDMEYMANLILNRHLSEENIEHFCLVIKKNADYRQAKIIFESAIFELDKETPSDGIVSQAIKSLMELDRVTQKYDHTMKDSIISALESYETASEMKGLIGITTGIQGLDDALGGFHDSDLVIVGARPAVGKTAIAFNFAHSSTKPVGIISAEQDHAQAGARFISMEGRINSKNFRSARLTELEYGRLGNTVKTLEEKPIFINDEPGIDINAIQRQARRWKQERDIGILFVDYIQKIKGSDKRASTLDRVTEVVNSLKDLARELRIPVIALAQVNRAADNLDGPPGLSHLSDASACEKEADSIITMYRDDDMREKGKTLLHICKNRHGPTGDVLVNYEGMYFKFTDSLPEYQNYAQG